MAQFLRFIVIYVLFSSVIGFREGIFSKRLRSFIKNKHKFQRHHTTKEVADDLVKYFEKRNIPPEKMYTKASTSFMLELYNVLQSGSSLVKAAGRGNLNQADLSLSDTIRSFTPNGNYFRFPGKRF